MEHPIKRLLLLPADLVKLETLDPPCLGCTKLLQSDKKVKYCLISYRAGAWHNRIFPDLLNSGFKMASKIEVKQRSLRAVETILRAILLQEVNILQQRTVVLLL